MYKGNDTTEPYSWIWDERAFLKHTIKVVAVDFKGNIADDEIIVWNFPRIFSKNFQINHLKLSKLKCMN